MLPRQPQLRLALLVALATTATACDLFDPSFLTGTPPTPGDTTPTATGAGPMPEGRRLSDGARAVGPTAEGGGLTDFHRLGDPGQPVDADHVLASSAYRAVVPATDADAAPLILAIPVDPAALPADWDSAGLRVEVRGEGGWRTVAAMGRYDPERKLYWCRLARPAAELPAVQLPPEEYRVAQSTGAWTVEIRLAYILSALQTVRKEGSPFRFHYYPTKGTQKHTVPSDADWTGAGTAAEPGVPNYIEDLDAALQEAYTGLLALTRTGGKPVFTAPSLPIDVTVTDTGGEAGNSDLGGPIEIGARAIASYEDMRAVAAHELVHLLQGQYYSLYGLFTGRLNTWFIEATANHLAARVLKMTPEARRAFYGDGMSGYLGKPLNAADDGSMYAAGHFLDYLTARTDERLIGDILAGPGGNDLTAITAALDARGIKGGVGTMLAAYVEEIVRTPEGTAGLHQQIKAGMEAYALAEGHVESTAFTKTAAHRRIRRTLPPFATFYGGFVPRHRNNGLLVVKSAGSQGALLKSVAFDTISQTDAPYKGRLAIDRYDQVPAKAPWLIRNYGPSEKVKGAEWAVTNTSAASSAKLDMDAYVLPYTFESNQESGLLEWVTTTAASIPRELLVGWHVYDGYTELTTTPLPVTGTGQLQRFSDPRIPDVGLRSIVIEDAAGNFWPERNQYIAIDPDNPSTLKPGESIRFTARVVGRDNQDVTWTLKPDDPNRPGSLVASGNSASYAAPNAGNDECVGASIVVTSESTPILARSVYVQACGEITQFECVPADTPVTLEGGATRRIAEVRVGDRVLALGPDGESLAPAVVEKVLLHPDAATAIHRLSVGDGRSLRITGNHPVKVKGRGWVPVEALRAGDTLYVHDPARGRLVEMPLLVIIKEEGRAGVVYNLKTSRASYLAGGVMVHNKCLAAGTPIDTPDGVRAVEAIAVGDRVWASAGGRRVVTRVTEVFRKDVAAPALPGRLVAPGVKVTDNHPLWRSGRFVPAGQAGLPAVAITGPVYDLRTEAGTYFAGGQLMTTGDAN